MKTASRQSVAAAVLAMTACMAWSAQDAGSAPPEPALYPAPKAVKSLLLDVTYTGERYVAVGDYGVILRSVDHSEDVGAAPEWRQARSPVSVMLNHVAFGDRLHGWAVGHDGVILSTADGGENWAVQLRDTSGGQAFYDVHADSAQRAIVVGNGQAVRTTDGGNTWEPLTGPLFDLNWNFNAITRLNNDCLMIAGERGILARSCDNGKSWQQIRTPYVGSFYGVLPYGAIGAVVYGMRGRVYVTEDVPSLSTVDPESWDPYMAQTITDREQLADLGWRVLETPVERNLFDGLHYRDNRAVFVGVAGSVIVGDLENGSFSLVPNDSNEPISAAVSQDRYLLTVGRGGIRHVEFEQGGDDHASR